MRLPWVVRQGETSHGPRAAAPISEMRIGDGVKGDSNCDLPMSDAAIVQAFLVDMMGVRVPGEAGAAVDAPVGRTAETRGFGHVFVADNVKKRVITLAGEGLRQLFPRHRMDVG